MTTTKQQLAPNPFPTSQRERDIPKLNLALQTLKKNGDIDADQHQQLSSLVSSGNNDIFNLATLVQYNNSNGWQENFKKQALALIKVKEVKKVVKEKKKKVSIGSSKSKNLNLNINTQAAKSTLVHDEDEESDSQQADELLRKKKKGSLKNSSKDSHLQRIWVVNRTKRKRKRKFNLKIIGSQRRETRRQTTKRMIKTPLLIFFILFYFSKL